MKNNTKYSILILSSVFLFCNVQIMPSFTFQSKIAQGKLSDLKAKDVRFNDANFINSMNEIMKISNDFQLSKDSGAATANYDLFKICLDLLKYQISKNGSLDTLNQQFSHNVTFKNDFLNSFEKNISDEYKNIIDLYGDIIKRIFDVLVKYRVDIFVAEEMMKIFLIEAGFYL